MSYLRAIRCTSANACLAYDDFLIHKSHTHIPWAPENKEASEHEGIHHSDSPRERAMNMAADEEGSNAREQKTSFLSQLFCLLFLSAVEILIHPNVVVVVELEQIPTTG